VVVGAHVYILNPGGSRRIMNSRTVWTRYPVWGQTGWHISHIKKNRNEMKYDRKTK
jgi:hypothetical protein